MSSFPLLCLCRMHVRVSCQEVVFEGDIDVVLF